MDGRHPFRCVIVGDGPLRNELQERIRDLGLAEVVTLAGARTREELLPVLQDADIFALTPYVTQDGDRDGIPNVVVEAMACGMPVVATAVGGIPEVVVPGVTGLLAAVRDVPEIARHLAALLDDRRLRSKLGDAARQAALGSLDSRIGARQLAGMLAVAGMHSDVSYDRAGRP
jgi:glycosyltransferase involved in cell wall biosynthesis